MELKINNYQTSFKAQMQLNGNINLLKDKEIQTLKAIIDKIGTKTDIVDIKLTEKVINKGFIPIATFANNKLSQFIGESKNDDVYSGIINALEQTTEIFPNIATIMTSSLVTKKTEEIEKNTVIGNLEKTNNQEISTNKNQSNNLEMINIKIDEFMDYMNNRRLDMEESFIPMTMRNSIHNDSFLQNEYSKRMKQKTYMVFDRYSDDGDITYKHYTGNDSIDIKCEDGDWYNVSTKTINEMLQENDLREKMVQATLQLLNKNKVLENFNIEELAGYDEKLNKKFRDFIKLNNMEYPGRNYIILEHPITDCIWNSISTDSDLSEYLREVAKDSSSYYRFDKIQKAWAISEALQNDLYRTQIRAQLLLNFPAQMPSEKQKEILDKILQSTIRDNTPEEDKKIRSGEYVDYFYKKSYSEPFKIKV